MGGRHGLEGVSGRKKGTYVILPIIKIFLMDKKIVLLPWKKNLEKIFFFYKKLSYGVQETDPSSAEHKDKDWRSLSLCNMGGCSAYLSTVTANATHKRNHMSNFPGNTLTPREQNDIPQAQSRIRAPWNPGRCPDCPWIHLLSCSMEHHFGSMNSLLFLN